SLANEQYVNDDNINHVEINYLNKIICTRSIYIIQQVANMIDECVMDFHFNSKTESHLSTFIGNHFLSQSSTIQLSNLIEQSEHLVVMPQNFFDLNQVLNMLSCRWGTECEHFWLVMLKCIGFATKQNAIETIIELLLKIDLSIIPLNDEIITNRMNLARELITTLELKWKDVVSFAVDRIVEKTLIYKKLDLSSLAINTQSMRVYKTLVYFIVTHPETSNINLTELTSGSLVTSKTCKCILDALGNSYRKLLRNFRCMLNSHNDRIETTSSGWLLLLLLYATSNMLKKSSARYIIACCNELIGIWFDVMSKQSQLTNFNGKRAQWDKTIAILEMIGM
ncbi:3867_t:CDS:2, partial [Scutellospora calospora]